VSFVIAFVALGLTVLILPGVHVRNALTVGEAVIVFWLLNAAVRPLLLAVLLPLSIIAVGIGSVLFQGAMLLALGRFVPGLEVDSIEVAFAGSWLFAIANTLLAALVSIDRDESYYGTLIRQLVARRQHVIRSAWPGLVVVQFDGLAHPVLQHQVRAGRVPVVARWLRSGTHRLARWDALLPSQTSASQAGLMFGRSDGIPAFRWYEKSSGRLIVSNHPNDAIELERRLSRGDGILAGGGASIGNLLSGDAKWSFLTMSRLRDGQTGIGRDTSFYFFFLSPYNYLHSVVLGVAEIVRELIQGRRQRLAGIEPRIARPFSFAVGRAATNVVLRDLSTSLVIEQMYRGTPTIWVDYTDYDEIAHHAGPERAEALDAADGVDGVLGLLERAAQDAPRPYQFVVLSDHGQTLGATFRQRYGASLEQLVGELMGGPTAIAAATARVEEWGPINTFLTELARSGGLTGRATRRALRRRTEDGLVSIRRPGPTQAGTEGDQRGPPEVVVAASGNLANVYFPTDPGRMTLEAITQAYPGLVDALANHPGIGFVMARTEAGDSVVVGRQGLRRIGTGAVEGIDPVEPFGPLALEGLRRLDSFDTCGDLVLISTYDPDTDEVAAFEELVGSHGGLGGMQTAAFLLHPAEWTVDGPLVGAPAVHDQLVRWLASIRPREAPG
jgi:uncharacterized membrane protein YvlD (DUF360 family)